MQIVTKSKSVVFDLTLALLMLLSTAFFTVYLMHYAATFDAQTDYNLYEASQSSRARCAAVEDDERITMLFMPTAL